MNSLDPAISRALWDIAQIAAQVQRVNDAAKALAATNPEATLKMIAAKRWTRARFLVATPYFVSSARVLSMSKRRWRWVFLASVGPLAPGWAASHTL